MNEKLSILYINSTLSAVWVNRWERKHEQMEKRGVQKVSYFQLTNIVNQRLLTLETQP
jgi:hypothetical protein